MPPLDEIKASRYSMTVPSASFPYLTPINSKVDTDHVPDLEMRNPHSVSSLGHWVFLCMSQSIQEQTSTDVLNTLPKRLESINSGESENGCIGWGIEIIEGPSWRYFVFTQILPLLTLCPAIFFFTLWILGSHGQANSNPPVSWPPRLSLPPIDIFLIAISAVGLIFALLKGAEMLAVTEGVSLYSGTLEQHERQS